MTLRYEVETITPRKAETYLNANKCNRALREDRVQRYAADMRDGRWTDGGDPIKIYESGDVADGQHRLWAIIESGVPLRLLVVRGLNQQAGLNLDTHAARTLVDNARISGIGDISHAQIAISRAIEEGSRLTAHLSNSQKLDHIAKHEEACRWVMKNGPQTRGLRNALTQAAICRAWYHEPDKERLIKFCEVFGKGFSNGAEDAAAIAIRNYIQSGTSALMAVGPQWIDTFWKMQNAIYYFMRRKQLTVIKKVSAEAYPLVKRNTTKRGHD